MAALGGGHDRHGGRAVVRHAQATRPATEPAAAAAADDTLVGLNLPENAPLKVLIDYVSQEFSLNILYDEQVGNQRITIKAPAKLPRERGAEPARFGPADEGAVDGRRRPARLAAGGAAPAGGPGARGGRRRARRAGEAVTQVFRLKYSEATKLDTVVKPFLTQPGASSFPLPEQGLLVVSDYAANLKRVAELIESVDRPNQEVGIEFVPVKHADPARLTQQLDQLLRARLRTEGGGDRLTGAVETTYDARTNQVVVIAPKDRLADAREIISRLDTTVAEEQSPIKFYKLANTTAAEVLATIRSLEGEQDETATGTTAGPTGPTVAGDSFAGPADRSHQCQRACRRDRGIADGHDARAERRVTGNHAGCDRGARNPTLTTPARTAPASAGGYEGQTTGPTGSTARAPGSTLPEAPAPLREALRTKQARVTADPHTNTIIVVAPPDVQRLYEQLIRALDKRRPQVLIQATIVTIDTTNNFQLGVEIGRMGGFDRNSTITFTSFGLSTPDPQTGRLSLIPGSGFNGALISTDIADVVIRALQQNNRAKVSSAPRILVNDNNVGTLSSIAEFPYASVNASQHRRDDQLRRLRPGRHRDHGDAAHQRERLPATGVRRLAQQLHRRPGPAGRDGASAAAQERHRAEPGHHPRRLDDHRRRPEPAQPHVRMKQSVPFLGDIPVLEYLFSNRTNNEQNTTLFVFIRPVILRDDKFEDLKFLSAEDVRQAGIPADFPTSEPLMMR